MERMYQDYRDVAEFYIVYISEAHAEDDRFPVPYASELGIKEHKTFGERCRVADRLTKDKKLTIPCLIDGMDNATADAYQGWPDRIYLVRKDGRLGVAAGRGPWGFKPALRKADKWLASYKATGAEPEIVEEDDTPDFAQLQMDFMRALRAGDNAKALTIGDKLYALEPESINTLYNIACAHALLGHKKEAMTWLSRSVDAGYRDLEHLQADSDLDSLRELAAYKQLVGRMGQRVDADEGASGDFSSVLGEWEMKTQMGERAMEATMVLSMDGDRCRGVWKSQGREMKMTKLKLVGDKFSFVRSIGPDMQLKYHGTVDGDEIKGTYAGPMGELNSNGHRVATGK